MDTNKLTVYKANEVVEAAYRISLNEQRVVLACISQVDSLKELFKTDAFELSAKDFASIFGVSEKRAYQALVEVAENLFNRYIVINNPFPEKPQVTKLKTRWISSILYNKSEGKIVLRFAEDMLPYLSNLERCFTKYELKHIGKMTSIYGIRLYELLMQWKATGSREVEISWLKELFELDEGYSRMYDLKKYVIEPAIKDINTHSNFSVQYEQRKTGRTVTHLIFTFAEKKSEQPEVTPKAVAISSQTEVRIENKSTLTDEQFRCWQWAKTSDFWKKIVVTEAIFLKLYNREDSSVRLQYEAAVGIGSVSVRHKVTEAQAKNAHKLEITNLRNEIAHLENMQKLSPNPAIDQQITTLKQKLEKAMKS